MNHSSAAHIAAAIERWLLDSEVQLRTGPECGGVAGTLDMEGRPEFLYPEAAGYFLSWLAFLAESGKMRPEIENRARLAADWIARSIERGELRTRLYLVPNGHDWRNHAVFAFDLGMVWRGISAASRLAPESGSVLIRLSEELQRFIAGCELAACRPVAGDAYVLPQRWSTQPGPYQMKITAPLLRAPARLVPENLRKTAAFSYQYWRNHLQTDPPLEEPHALFYSLEGLLQTAACGYDPDGCKLAAGIYTSLFSGCDLPECFDRGSGPARSDVVAQALRVGSVLLASGQLENTNALEQLDRLASCLAMYVSPAGAVRFLPNGTRPLLSTWSAMFAHQAFCYYAAVLRGESLPARWVELLV